jgi:hypothetical protein
VNLLSRVQAFLLQNELITEERFNPTLHFIGILQATLTDGIAKACSISAESEIYLFPKENAVYIKSETESLIPIVLSEREQISVKEMTDKELLEKVNYANFSSRLSNYASFLEEDFFQDVAAKEYTCHSFTEIHWFSTFLSSQGRLLIETSYDEAIFLPEIPEFISKNYPELVALFSLLDNVTLTSLLSLSTEQSRYEKINFYNACLLLSNTEVEQSFHNSAKR